MSRAAWVVSILLCGCGVSRHAVGLQYTAGVATHVGDLSDERAALVQSAQIHTMYWQPEGTPLEAFLAIDTLWTAATHTKERFPYPEDADLRVLAFLFVPTLCAPGVGAPLQGCLGLGQGTVNVNAEQDRRDWGTWNYHAMLRWHVLDAWSVVLMSKYIGRVEQQVSGEDAWFTVLSQTAGLSWRW